MARGADRAQGGDPVLVPNAGAARGGVPGAANWAGWELGADYHTHTRFSHGKGTIEENVEAAWRRGLGEIGISDHGPALMFIGIKGERVLGTMRREVDRVQGLYPGIKVWLGVEANVITPEGDIDITADALAAVHMLLVGLHPQLRLSLWKGAGPLVWNHVGARLWERYAERARAVNTRALVNAVLRHPVRAVTHAGLKMDVDMGQLAAVCARRGTAIEVNSLHGYPSVEAIRQAVRQGARFIVSSDAHHPEQVGQLEPGFARVQAAEVPPELVLNARQARAERRNGFDAGA